MVIPKECKDKNKIKLLPCFVLELCDTCKFRLTMSENKGILTKDTENELVQKFLKKKKKGS